MSTSYELLLRHCRLLHPTSAMTEVDIAIAAGKIVAIAPQIPATAQLEIDVVGQLVSPPLWSRMCIWIRP